MKKILLIVMMIFSLSYTQHVWAFSEEVLNASIEEYIQFFEQWTTKPPAQNNEKEAVPAVQEGEKGELVIPVCEDKTVALKKQLMVSRRAQALSQAVVDIGNDVYNLFLLALMKRYVEEAGHRDALQLLVDELIKIVGPELEARENHRVWKSAIQGGSDGFYVLATLEVLNAVGKRTKAFEKLSSMLQKTSQAVPVVVSEAADFVVKGGASGGNNVLLSVRGESFSLLSLRPSPIQTERWTKRFIGKPGLPRIGRVVAVGVLLGMLYDGYAHHWTEQKLDPSLLFEMIQTLAILDLAARVVEFREEISSQSSSLSFEQQAEFLESHQATQKLLVNELKHFETAPKFLANVSIDVAKFEDHPLKLFLDSFYEENPKVKEALIQKEVSFVSLSPIELMLEDSAILLQRAQEKIMQEALTQPPPENR